MHILFTGGTGFVGTALVNALLAQGHTLTVLVHHSIPSDERVKTIKHFSELSDDTQIDVIINLAGAPISQRWTKRVKKNLFESRIKITRALYTLVNRLRHKPKALINASAVGFYGAQGDAVLDETAKPHLELTHALCEQWERNARRLERLGLRVCVARLGVVLGAEGGALPKLLPAFNFGLGGKLGTGRQYFSWVALDDAIEAFLQCIQDESMSGVYNFTAPQPVTNAEFTHTLGRLLHKPTFCTVPSFVVKLLFGEMGETLLLKGNRVVPKRLLAKGFKFQYPTLETALSHALRLNSKAS